MNPWILLVEDDELLAELTREYLQAHGIDVRVEHDGQDALKVMSKKHPDLVVADVQIPSIRGDQLVMIRNSQPALAGIPIVLWSGHTFPDDGQQIGADGYLAKSSGGKALLEEILKWVGPSGSNIAVSARGRRIVGLTHRAVRAMMRHCNLVLTREERDILKLIASRLGMSLEQLLRDALIRVLTELENRSPKEISLLGLPGVSRKAGVSCSTYLEQELDQRFDKVALEVGAKKQAIWRVTILSLLGQMAH